MIASMADRKTFKEMNGSVVLYPDNYINDIEGERLEGLCEGFLNKGTSRFIIDFSGTDLINSIGVSILIGVIEKIMEKKGSLFFSGLKKVNHDIFKMVGLTKHITVFATEKDALQHLEKTVGGVRA